MRPPERVPALKKALGVDRVLSLVQVRRYFSLDLQPWEFSSIGLHCVVLWVKPRSDIARMFQYMHFVSAEKYFYRSLTDTQITHLVGTAEIRLSLGIPAECWTSSASALGAQNQPDAIYVSDQGKFAVEYDAGKYSRETISKKIDVFSDVYQGILWGTISDLRANRLKLHYRAQAQVTVLNWWE